MAGEAKNGILPYKGGTYYLWHYVPSMPGAIIFLILFIVAAAAHSYRMFRFRQWFYIPFILGCICKLATPISSLSGSMKENSPGWFAITNTTKKQSKQSAT